MRAVVVAPDHSLSIAEVTEPTVRPGAVSIQVAATAVNRADLHQRAGTYPPPPGASEILGLEVAGTIASIGEGVEGWSVGDRVAALLSGGGYAERVVCPAGHLLPIGDLSWAEAAALPEALAASWLTLVREAHVAKGERVLLHAGASSIGCAAIQVARHLGAVPSVTVGSEAKLAFCESLGAAGGIGEHPKDASWTSESFDVILCPIGAAYLAMNLQLLAIEGRLVIYGLLGGRAAEVDLGRLMVKRQRIIGTVLRARSAEYKSALLAELRASVWSDVLAHRIAVPIHATFALADVEAAHALVAANENVGKVVLTVDTLPEPE